MKSILNIILSIIIACVYVSCIEDGISTSPNDQPRFSVDTLDLGTVFTGETTVTSRMTVYNPNKKGINLSRVELSGPDARLFRLNVDGVGGDDFSNIEIRANDSIFVFVDVNIPDNNMPELTNATANIDFTVNGIVSSVVIAVQGQNINRIQGVTISQDMNLTSEKPYQIKDSLVVAEGVTLTLEAGTRLLFHDKADFIIRGTLISQGTPENPVIICGDRLGEVIPDVSFDIMSRQWGGMQFMESSIGNIMQYTDVSNTSYGVIVYGDGSDIETKKLLMINSRLRNSGEYVLAVSNASVEALGCEFSNAPYGLIYIEGGDHRFDQCTASNQYLFAAISGAAWTFVDPEICSEEGIEPAKALITNTITYGIGDDVYPGDLTGQEIYFNRCLFRSEGTDDANFIESIWGEDPLFYAVRNEYQFDFRVKDESPAIGSAFTALSENPLDCDYYGQARKGDLGAYVYIPTAE